MNKFSLILSAAVVALGTAAVSTPAMACGGCDYGVDDYIDVSAMYIDGEDSHEFDVRVRGGQTMTVNLRGFARGDLDLFVYDSYGDFVTSSTSGYATESVEFTARRSGIYTVVVSNLEYNLCIEYDLSAY